MGSAFKCILMISKDKCEHVKSSYLGGLLQLQPELSTSLQKPTSELTGNVIQHRNFPNICHQDSYCKISNIYINIACKLSWHLQDKNQPINDDVFSHHKAPGQQGLSTCHTTTPGSGRAFGWRYKVLMDGQCHCLETACFRNEWTWSHDHGRKWIPMNLSRSTLLTLQALPSRGRFSSIFEKTIYFCFECFKMWWLQISTPKDVSHVLNGS